eukprot:3366187-Pyramimonas_sp.AAC.1
MVEWVSLRRRGASRRPRMGSGGGMGVSTASAGPSASQLRRGTRASRAHTATSTQSTTSRAASRGEGGAWPRRARSDIGGAV